MITYNGGLKIFSRNLRSNMTKAEEILWSKIRKKQLHGYQFYRQKIIGKYIADFYCHKAKLVIEIDGSQHYTEEGIEYDKIRDDYMKSLEIKVIRFSNQEIIENINDVLEVIILELK